MLQEKIAKKILLKVSALGLVPLLVALTFGTLLTAPSFAATTSWTATINPPQGITANTTFNAPPIQSGQTPDSYFAQTISQAVAGGYHKIVFPTGTYNFLGPKMFASSTSPSACNAANYSNCAPHLTIGGSSSCGSQTPCYPLPNTLNDLEIDFSNSTLNFAAPTTGIQIEYAQRIKLENVTIDYPNLPVSALGTVIADPNKSGHKALAIDDAYPISGTNPMYTQGGLPNPQVQAVNTWVPGQSPDIGHFDSTAGNNDVRDEVYFIFADNTYPTYVGKQIGTDGKTTYNQVYSCSPSKYPNPISGAQDCNFGASGTTATTCSFTDGSNKCANFDYFPTGARVAVRYFTYNGAAISIGTSNDVDLENVHINSSPGMGVLTDLNGGYHGFKMMNSSISRTGSRPVSAASDGVHFGVTGGEIDIENSVFDHLGDDAMSIHSTLLALPSNPVISVTNTGAASSHAATVRVPVNCADPNLGDDVVVGDSVAFLNASMATVDTAKVTATKLMCSGGSSEIDATFGQCTSGDCAKTVGKITANNMLVDLTNQSAQHYIVSGNTIFANRGHAALLNAPYGQLANNVMYQDSFGGIGFDSGYGASNLTISGNEIYQTGWTPAIMAAQAPTGSVSKTSLATGLTISNNNIHNVPGPAIVVSSASTVAVKNNTISNSNTNSGSVWALGLPTTSSIYLYGITTGSVCGTVFNGTHGAINSSASTNITVATKC